MFRTEANAVSGPAAQFVADFNNTLKQLTFNSRPIILALTDLARENRAFAREVVDTIEIHIRSCSSQLKLPALYVLDSICKNVGNEYISLAERNLFTTVTSIFDSVDDQTRSSILHLLRTWTDTGLFPPATLDRINIRLRNIMQKSGRFVQPQSSRDAMPAAPFNNQGMPMMQSGAPGLVIAPNMLQQGYAHLAQAGISNPLAAAPASVAAVTATALAELDSSEIPILSRLYQILTNSNAPPPMSPQDLLAQRAAILGHVQAALAQNRLPSNEAVGLIQQLQQLHSIRAMLQQSPAAPKPQVPIVAPAPAPAPHVGLFSMPGRPQPVHAAPPVAVAPPPVANPLSQLLGGGASNSLFQSLQSALQGANTSRPAQPNLAAPPVQPPSNKAAPPMMVATSGRPDFRDPDSLKKPYASVISALYDDFKHRCSQCGLRFQEKAKLDDHLDWHFQQKRKEKVGVKKAFSRSWFVAANDWQQSKGGLISLVTMRLDGATDAKGKSDEESSSDEKKPATVPADETQPNCAGCGEEFEQFHDDDTEQWLFNNAIKAPDGKIYHPQCYTPQTEGDEVRLARKRAHDEMTPSTDAVANGDDVSKKPRIE